MADGRQKVELESTSPLVLESGFPLFLEYKLALTATDILQLPINCVLAGHQEPIKKAMGLSGAISGPMRGIFGE